MKRMRGCGARSAYEANSQVSSAELRGQFAGLKALIDALPTLSDVDVEIGNHASNNTDGVATLVQTISNPPTQVQVQAIQNKLNELIVALKQP